MNLDEHLNLKKHSNKIVSHGYKLVKDIGRVRNMLTETHTEMLVHAVIASRLDYCNLKPFDTTGEITNWNSSYWDRRGAKEDCGESHCGRNPA